MNLQEHKDKSQHNFNTYAFLNEANPTYTDWEITTLFYSILHLVDAYLYKQQVGLITNHMRRKEYVKQYMSSIYCEYLRLEELSKQARYKCSIMSKKERDEAFKLYNTIRKKILPHI